MGSVHFTDLGPEGGFEVEEGSPEHKRLLAEGHVPGEQAELEAGDGVLKGEALNDRAAELDIEGRSEMTADEKRAAIAEREAELEEGDTLE